jgi:hypothetical protein
MVDIYSSSLPVFSLPLFVVAWSVGRYMSKIVLFLEVEDLGGAYRSGVMILLPYDERQYSC